MALMSEWADMFGIEEKPEKASKPAQASKSSKKVAALKVRKQAA